MAYAIRRNERKNVDWHVEYEVQWLDLCWYVRVFECTMESRPKIHQSVSARPHRKCLTRKMLRFFVSVIFQRMGYEHSDHFVATFNSDASTARKETFAHTH